MVSCRQHGQNVEEPRASERDRRDFEMDEIRRQLKEVQECLDSIKFYEFGGCGARHLDSEIEAASYDEEDVYQFHYAHSQGSHDITLPYPQRLRNFHF